LSTRFTQHGAGQSEPPSGDALDQQQAVLLEMLRRAAGAPVSYAQLHDAGIEFPASVVSELELQDCLRPVSETCLTYAYALYDLGRALRLDGDPSAAVPILQRRLRIENQRPTVQAQLELALARTS
jgi:hypothetical protein